MKELLLVEDDVDSRETLAEILRMRGYAVKTADNGQDAWDQLQSGSRPCLIILDLMMPVMNGWEFRAKQLTAPELASVPVVLLSAAADLEQHVTALGAAGCLPKPINLPRVLETVAGFCSFGGPAGS